MTKEELEKKEREEIENIKMKLKEQGMNDDEIREQISQF